LLRAEHDGGRVVFARELPGIVQQVLEYDPQYA
jgi:hypothetical protein